MKNLVVVNMDGPELDEPVLRCLIRLHRQGIPIVVVHDQDASPPEDDDDAEILELLGAARTCKLLVSRLQRAGVQSVGLCGIDGATLEVLPAYSTCHRDGRGVLPAQGQVSHVNAALVLTLLREGFLPVISPIGLGDDGRSYPLQQAAAAFALARALEADRLVCACQVSQLSIGLFRKIPTHFAAPSYN